MLTQKNISIFFICSAAVIAVYHFLFGITLSSPNMEGRQMFTLMILIGCALAYKGYAAARNWLGIVFGFAGLINILILLSVLPYNRAGNLLQLSLATFLLFAIGMPLLFSDQTRYFDKKDTDTVEKEDIQTLGLQR